MTSISKYNINNSDNYNKKFTETSVTIFTKYTKLINDYLKHCLDNIYIQNQQYYIYVVKKGISTISHVFKLLLLYTKNLDLVFTNCQKAYIYYIEFIGQIGEDNHSFLQLNSKDASLFVYKKTIFEINNEYKIDFNVDEYSNKIILDINSLTNIYNNIIYRLIDNNNIISVIEITNTDLQNIINKIIKLFIDQNNNNNNNNNNKLDAIYIFITLFKKNNFIDYLDHFIKKIKKKNCIDISVLEKYLLDDDIYNNSTIIKFISLLVY